MSKVVVLGGCGAVGSVAAKTLASAEDFSKVVIADINMERAAELVAEIGADKAEAVKVDALDSQSVKAAIEGAAVVLNCTGPFYKFVKPVLTAVIESGIDYVDVCDDVDVTEEILAMDQMAKDAGVCALIGMGSSPGVTNILGKFAAETLLDETEAIDIYHAHGGEPVEGEGVIAHRFHCMSIDVPQYIDGELKSVKFFEPDGIALREKVGFHRLGDGHTVYPYPHPEQLTMPRYIKTRRVTNKGTVLPEEYFNLIAEMCRIGLQTREPLNVRGVEVSPYDFSIAYILKRRDEILKEVNFGVQRGCVKVVVTGKRGGAPHQFIFSMASEDQALGEGTGIPAAFGTLLMKRGKVEGKGVMPPEACVNPADFISLVSEIIKPSEGGKSFEGVIVESIDADGKVSRMDI